MKKREDGRIWYSGAWRTEDQIERIRAKNRERAKKKWWGDDEYRAKRHEQQRKYGAQNREKLNKKRRDEYHGNLERSRSISRQREKKQREKRGDEINARQREYYRKNADRLREQINQARIRREPYRGLEKALREFERGDRSYNDLDRLYRQRLAWAHERNVQKRSGRGCKDTGPRQSSNSSCDRSSNQRSDEDQT